MEKDKQSIERKINKELPSNALDALISGNVELETIKNINKTILDNMECKYTVSDVAFDQSNIDIREKVIGNL